MCLRILRGTCLGHFSGVHDLEYTDKAQIASFAAAFGAGQAASAASPAAISGSIKTWIVSYRSKPEFEVVGSNLMDNLESLMAAAFLCSGISYFSVPPGGAKLGPFSLFAWILKNQKWKKIDSHKPNSTHP